MVLRVLVVAFLVIPSRVLLNKYVINKLNEKPFWIRQSG